MNFYIFNSDNHAMNDLPNSPRFLRWLAATVFTGILVVIIFVIAIDPYRLYGFIEYRGLNAVKPGLGRYQNEIKLLQGAKARPNAFIMGNSRAEIGFDPDVPEFHQHNLTAYNFAIPGIGIDTVSKQLDFLAYEDIQPKFILLGMEFLDFIVLSQQLAEPSSKVGQSLNFREISDRWFWKFDVLFSLASVADAIRTILIQRDVEAPTMTAKGFNPLNQYKPIARSAGYNKLFQQRAQENAEVYLRKANGSISLNDFDSLRVIFDITAPSNGTINLIIYPYHSQILALFEETGLWPIFVEWKRLLINEISAAQKRHSHINIKLYDFSGYSRYNCERIPSLGDRESATNWYWEAGHFKKALGDIVLARILNISTPLALTADGNMDGFLSQFGFELDESNLNDNEERIRQERSLCMRDYPELFTETRSLVDAVRSKN